MGQGQSAGSSNTWTYVASELATHIPYEFFVRLKNFDFSPMNRLSSRRGLEPVRYFTNPSPVGFEDLDETAGMISPNYVADSDTDYLMQIETATLELFGDSTIISGPDFTSFFILPFSLTADGISKLYEYTSTDVNGNAVKGSERGGFHIYNGKCVFWNGLGTYQVFARTISDDTFTRLDNDVLPLEDQTIIGACTFENRLVVVSLQGFLMWSQPDWDGTSVWQDSEGNAINYIQISDDPGEIIEFSRAFRGGIILSTRTTANVSGRILNIPSLDPTQIQVIDTGVDSFFTRNSVIASTDQLVGISPQGVISVSYDSLARSAKAEFNTSAPIIEYLSEIYEDNSISAYIHAHLDTKNRKAYFIHDWSINRERTSKILVYDYNADRWSFFETGLCVQRIFQMYDVLCAAGWKRVGDKLYLAIYSFSDITEDIEPVPASFTDLSGKTHHYIKDEITLPIHKRFVTGTINSASIGKNEVPGTGQMPLQVLFTTEDHCNYKLGLRSFNRDSWGGAIKEFDEVQITPPGDIEMYATNDNDMSHGKWDVTLKNHYCYQRYNIPIPNHNLYYQLMFESSDPTRFHFHSIGRDRTRKL